MKIYTRTGDGGETGVIGGRLPKDDARLEAIGTVDELNSCIGVAVALMAEDRYLDLRADMARIQHELFDCGADLARVHCDEADYAVKSVTVDRLEQWIDRYDAEAQPLTRFILPGGSSLSAALHVCRTVCRRAERQVVAFAREQSTNAVIVRYLNRLSDLLFTVARAANVREGVADVEYVSGAGELADH